MSNKEYLVFFETSGNQAYIYATNKLRENVGASELTYRAGTQWVLEAAGFKNDVPTGKPAEFRQWLKSSPTSTTGVEVILSTSGKSLLVVGDRTTAEQLVVAVTARAAKEAPGLSISGAIVELAGRDTKSVAKAITDAHHRFNANRDLMPVPAQRFGMLPFCEPCATSGLPAIVFGEKGKAYAAPAMQKRGATGDWFKRIRQVFISAGQKKSGKARDKLQIKRLFIANGADRLEQDIEGLSWLGVVFSDGNGLGQIMMKFPQWLDEKADYLSTLRNFSVELDTATENAFYAACQHLASIAHLVDVPGKEGKKPRGKRLPVVPLLLGGDDLTVLVDGRYALPFTRAFLDAFDAETARQPTLSKIAQKALGAGRLSAGAGVAIVKPHFPFHSAHGLAESLLKSAKLAKKKVEGTNSKNEKVPVPCSSLDFHILFDAAYTGLDDIREARRKGAGDERLWGGPYATTPADMLGSAQSTEWAERHDIEKLMCQVRAINARDENGRLKLPSSQTHLLREVLAQGKSVADARLKELHWLDMQALKNGNGDSLFHDDDGTTATRFLDALTSAEFWGETTKEAAQ